MDVCSLVPEWAGAAVGRFDKIQKMTISETCNAFFIITMKSRKWLMLTAFIIVNFTAVIVFSRWSVGRPPLVTESDSHLLLAVQLS